MDDILISGTNIDVINDVMSFQSKSFDIKDLGEADVILNIKLIKDENGITLSQSHYVEKILSRFGYVNSKPSPTPYDPSVILRKNKKIAKDQLRYSQIIGPLMYLTSTTRPDISFAVSKLSKLIIDMHLKGHMSRSDSSNICTLDHDLPLSFNFVSNSYIFKPTSMQFISF